MYAYGTFDSITSPPAAAAQTTTSKTIKGLR